jgi:hypothetical protein
MHRIALSLSAFLFICTSTTAASIAQQRDRLPGTPLPDCGYVCIFAQSTELAQESDRSAQIRGQSPQRTSVPPDTSLSQVIPADFGGSDWFSLTDF